MAIREMTEELFRLRRQVKNLEREVRHLKLKLNDHQLRSPQASEEEEMEAYLEQVRTRTRRAVDLGRREDGGETNGDAGPLD